MEIKEMTIEQLEERKAAIVAELDAPEADLDALETEARAIKEEIESRKAEAAKKAEIRDAVASGSGEVIEKMKVEEKKMTNAEIRSSAAYADAWAKYIKTGEDKECRALLSENVSGTVPVPTMLEGRVRAEWEKNDILSRVKRTFVRGNLRVAFERSAGDAVVHSEGTSAPSEESLELGIVELKPESIKKWITISDEVMDLDGMEFLDYIYDEITNKVIKKAVAVGIDKIVNASTTHSASAIGIPKVNKAPGIMTIANAATYLSEDATNLCVVLNRLTEQNFNDAYAAGNFAVDPFAGMPRFYTSALPAYATADDNATYAIVGDLEALQYNFPNGDEVQTKFDELTLAEDDLVKVLGRLFAGYGVTTPGMLARLTKPAAVTT